MHPDAERALEIAAGLQLGAALADDVAAVRRAASIRRRTLAKPAPEVARIAEVRIGGAGLRARIYVSENAQGGGAPGFLYFHGGGFVTGDLETSHAFCAEVANACGCIVVSVDYRLAPEHPFPAAVDDALAALRWLVGAGGDAIGVDRAKVAIGGDSAGGALAAAACQALSGRVALLRQVLVYPVLDLRAASDAYRRFVEGPALNAARMRWYIERYAPDPRDRLDPRASPLLAPELGGQPPTLIVAAELDPLVDEGRAFAGRLRSAGTPAAYMCFRDQPHGFVSWGRYCAAAAEATDLVSTALRDAFHPMENDRVRGGRRC